nr:FAD-dependent 5-carboxymethylaminomethyl-2-thiouridine(34) oxidoreductase MnmC [Shewanella sp. NIFS-20-20]
MLWQLARLSRDDAKIILDDPELRSRLNTHNLAQLVLCSSADAFAASSGVPDPISLEQRQVLRRQQSQACGHLPLDEGLGSIAIIGGGLASAQLAYSLALRQRPFSLFCQDERLAAAASGNRQGALYPLLTPEHDLLSRFYSQGFGLSRQRLQYLSQHHPIAHDFCGVLQTGHDLRSDERLGQIASAGFPSALVQHCSAEQSNQLAGVNIQHEGLYYPQAGWVAPAQFTQACFDAAVPFGQLHFKQTINEIRREVEGWYLVTNEQRHGPFDQLVLANGIGINQFTQTKAQALSPFRGQVSHVPTHAQLSPISTVLCAKGYFTPRHNGSHCLGASYIKNPSHCDYSDAEQTANLAQLQSSYPEQAWTEQVDISAHEARVGIRMVSRDHFPVVGLATDIDRLQHIAQTTHFPQGHKQEIADFWQQQAAPVVAGLYLLGGLGSRGLCNGAIAAEMLASQLGGEFLPCHQPMVEMLIPNRLWLRKLIRGKQVRFD